jgi:hypothetical protein
MNELSERAIYRRAVEAVIWGAPAVNYELMYSAMAGNLAHRCIESAVRS